MKAVPLLDVDPFHIDYLNSFTVVEVQRPRLPFRFVSVFESAQMQKYVDAGFWASSMSARVQEERQEIEKFIAERGINYAWYQPHHYLVITEQALDYSPVLFKLTTGLVFKEQHEFDFNAWIEREGYTGVYPDFYRLTA